MGTGRRLPSGRVAQPATRGSSPSSSAVHSTCFLNSLDVALPGVIIGMASGVHTYFAKQPRLAIGAVLRCASTLIAEPSFALIH